MMVQWASKPNCVALLFEVPDESLEDCVNECTGGVEMVADEVGVTRNSKLSNLVC